MPSVNPQCLWYLWLSLHVPGTIEPIAFWVSNQSNPEDTGAVSTRNTLDTLIIFCTT